jgi:cell volume regulation protein A
LGRRGPKGGAAIIGVFTTLLVMLGAGLLAERAARATGLPDIVLFLVAGLLLGPVGGLVHIRSGGGAAGFILTFGAAFMLYEGGRRLGFGVLRRIWLGVTLLSTCGLLATAAVVALAAHLVGLSWPVAGLVAAVTAATDPATVIPLFRSVRVRARLARLLEAESACNDAVGAVLTFTLVGLQRGAAPGVPAAAGLVLRNILGGLGIGVVLGVCAAWLLPGGRGPALFDTREQGAILSLLLVLASYAAASALHASGFMAVFVAGVLTGNRDVVGTVPPRGHRRLHDAYLRQVTVLVRLLIFVVLGAAVDPALLARAAWPAGLVTLVLIFVARPVAVLICLPPDRVARWTVGEMRLAAWVRETGAVPAALAGALLAQGIPGARTVAAFVFMAVIGTILLQVPTTAWWARVSGVLEPPPAPR